MGFATQAIASSTKPIHFLYGRLDNGLQFHWFIMCSAENYKILSTKFGSSNVNLLDYGTIIASGLGSKPTAATKTMLKEKYGFDTQVD